MKAAKYNLPYTEDKRIIDIVGEHSIFTVVDKFGRVEYANSNFCTTLGINLKEVLGEPLKILESPLHSGLLYKNLWKSIKAKEKWNGVLQAKNINDVNIWLDTTIIPIEKEHKLVYLIVFKDVTEIHQKNIVLLNEQKSKKVFLKSIPFHVFSITKYGKILKVNKQFLDTEARNVVGTYIYDYISFSCYDIFKTNIYTAFKNKKTKHFKFYDFDFKGAKSYYRAVISPNFNEIGEVVSLTLCVNDVTDFIEIDKKEQEREAKYRLIYKSIDVGIIVVANSAGKIKEWNKGAELAFGYKEKEILGRPFAILTTEKNRERNIKELLTAVEKLEDNKNVDIIELQCLRKNGEEFPVEFTLSSLTINGKTSYCAMMLDISKRKTLENKLQEKTEDLESFLYRSAHDLRAPFASAQGLLNLLKEEKDINKAQEIVKMLDTTINNGKLLSNKLLEASVISAKKHEYRRIDFSKIIRNVLIKLRNASNIENIDFSIDVDVPKNYKTKPELIISLFRSLIQNAIQFSRPIENGYVPKIEVVVKKVKKHIVIEINDNGIGIEKKNISKIFNLYYKSNNDNCSGSGLGLYIVKSIVEGLEGDIKVKSSVAENSGTSFKIKLPYSNK
ncbi:PAS domain S-box protein [Lacinutrix sp. MedPE-SW]|uniref:PAS domain S-box protein n=1 Tax=Lacinutrix sp. MedPE-SW TaxID=1860087 RepID=UPI00091A0E3A|nr:PAS domain S-box protein [Lacinutrix sp. MedPE-SW]OIQ22286.1 MAG: hypothetical protein BM549_07270 [Lacinutrix sp. MedPE-SW]